MIIAVGIVFFVLHSTQNAILPLPVTWAYLGIYQFLKTPESLQGQHGMLRIVALAGMVVLIGIAAIRLYLNNYELYPKKQD